MSSGSDTLVSRPDTLTSRRDSRTARCDKPTARRDSLAARRDKPTARRDTITARRDNPTARRDNLIARRDNPISPPDRLLSRRDRPISRPRSVVSWLGSVVSRLRARRKSAVFRRRTAVSRVLSRRRLPDGDDGHSSRPTVADGLEQPKPGSRGTGSPGRKPLRASSAPCSVLLRAGFAVPPLSPGGRCALTAPFHPYRRQPCGAPAVCSLWHFPSSHPDWPLASALALRSSDFPLAPAEPHGDQRPPHRLWRKTAAKPYRRASPKSRPRSGLLCFGYVVRGSPDSPASCAFSSMILSQ